MTPEERNTVIEALDYTHRRLQADIDDGSRPDQWSMEDIVRKCSAALAIMRGEREPVAKVLADGDCFRLIKHLPAGTRLYKD